MKACHPSLEPCNPIIELGDLAEKSGTGHLAHSQVRFAHLLEHLQIKPSSVGI